MHILPTEPRMRVREAAAFLGVSEDTVYKETRARRLGCYRIAGKFFYVQSELERFILASAQPSLQSAA